MKNEKAVKVLKEVAGMEMLPKDFRFNRKRIWDQINKELDREEESKKIFRFKKIRWRDCLNWAAAVFLVMAGVRYFIPLASKQRDQVKTDSSTLNIHLLKGPSPRTDGLAMQMEIFGSKETGDSVTDRRYYGVIWNGYDLEIPRPVRDSMPVFVFGGYGNYGLKLLVSNSGEMPTGGNKYSRNNWQEAITNKSPETVGGFSSIFPDRLSLYTEEKDSVAVNMTFNQNELYARKVYDMRRSLLQELVTEAKLNSYFLQNAKTNYFQTTGYSRETDLMLTSDIREIQYGLNDGSFNKLMKKNSQSLRNNIWEEANPGITGNANNIEFSPKKKVVYYSGRHLDSSRMYNDSNVALLDVEADNLQMEIGSFNPNLHDSTKKGNDILKSLTYQLNTYPQCTVELSSATGINQNYTVVNGNGLVKLYDIIMKMDRFDRNHFTIQIVKNDRKENDIQVTVSAW